MADLNAVDRPSAPLSWRDVYRAVGESESRVIQSIKDAVGPLTAQATDHEARIRMIENGGSPEAKEALARVHVLEASVTPLAVLASERDRRLTAVESQSNANAIAIARFNDRELGIFSTLGAGRTLLLVLAGILSPIVAVIALILK